MARKKSRRSIRGGRFFSSAIHSVQKEDDEAEELIPEEGHMQMATQKITYQ